MTEDAGAGTGLRHYGIIHIPVTELASGPIPPNPVTRDNTQGYAYSLAVGVGDSSSFQFVIPDDIEFGRDLRVWFSWCIDETYALANGEVNWQVNWETTAMDETQLIGTGTAGVGTTGDQNIPALALSQTEDSVNIDDGDIARGDLCRCIISRIDIVDGVDPTAEPEIYSIRIEYSKRDRTYDRTA